MWNKGLAAWAVWIASAAIPALAVEGRVALIGQTTITTPGSYIVTQDFSVASGNAITVSANNVTLDLNGHTITNSGAAFSDVNVLLSAGTTGARIRNGHLMGGGVGIMAPSGSSNVDLLIDHVEVAGTASTAIIVYGARTLEVVSSLVHDTLHGLAIIPVAGLLATGRIVDSVFDPDSNPVTLQDCTQMEVRGNIITARQNNGLAIFHCTGSRIEDNTITYASGTANFSGLSISSFGGGAPGNLVLNNTVRGFLFGIDIGSNGNRIAGNTVQATSHGIVVSGSRNLIEGNQVEGSGGCGISFSAAGANAYRNNMLRGNTGGGACGLANTDAGGNIF